MKRFHALLLVGLISLLLGVSVHVLFEDRGSEIPPEPLLVDLQGVAHPLSEWRGKYLVLNFWATWCQPCREEMKEFSELQLQWGPKGVQFVGVAIDDPEAVSKFLKEHPVAYPILIGGDKVPEWSDSLGNEISALPFTVVLDPAGRRLHARIGLFRPDALRAVLSKWVDDLS